MSALAHEPLAIDAAYRERLRNGVDQRWPAVTKGDGPLNSGVSKVCGSRDQSLADSLRQLGNGHVGVAGRWFSHASHETCWVVWLNTWVRVQALELTEGHSHLSEPPVAVWMSGSELWVMAEVTADRSVGNQDVAEVG